MSGTTRKWTREEIIARLQVLADRLGHTPSQNEYWESELASDDPFPPFNQIEDQFGSWNAAKRAAGLPTSDPGTSYSENELTAFLQGLADELGRSPTLKDVKRRGDGPSASQFLTAFGSWNEAKEAAGLETYWKEGRGEPYTEDELLTMLRAFADRIDGVVTLEKVNKADDMPSPATYQRHFGSFTLAKERAGLDPSNVRPRQIYTDNELLDQLRDLASELDHPVRKRDVSESDHLPSASTYERRFGSWNQAKDQAGLPTQERGAAAHRPTYSDSELLDYLRDLAEETGSSLTKADVDAADWCPSSSTYERRFASWSAAKQKAGID